MSSTSDQAEESKTKDIKQSKPSKSIFKQSVDIHKVNAVVIKKWITTELQKILPDDEIALEFIFELLFGAENGKAFIHPIKEQLNDFVGKEQSEKFCLELWELLLDAQNNPTGVPTKLVEERAKQLEERKRKLDEEAQNLEKQNDLRARQRATHILSQIRSEGKKVSNGERNKGRDSKAKRKVEKGGERRNRTNYNRS